MNPLYICMAAAVLFFIAVSVGTRQPRIFFRIALNGVLGVLAISIVNRILAEKGIYIGTNPFTVGMISIFGIPGFISVAAMAYFL